MAVIHGSPTSRRPLHGGARPQPFYYRYGRGGGGCRTAVGSAWGLPSPCALSPPGSTRMRQVNIVGTSPTQPAQLEDPDPQAPRSMARPA